MIYSVGLGLVTLGCRPDTLCFRRGSGARRVVNMGSEPIPLPDGAVVLSSDPLDGGRIPGDTAVWLAAS